MNPIEPIDYSSPATLVRLADEVGAIANFLGDDLVPKLFALNKIFYEVNMCSLDDKSAFCFGHTVADGNTMAALVRQFQSGLRQLEGNLVRLGGGRPVPNTPLTVFEGGQQKQLPKTETKL